MKTFMDKLTLFSFSFVKLSVFYRLYTVCFSNCFLRVPYTSPTISVSFLPPVMLCISSLRISGVFPPSACVTMHVLIQAQFYHLTQLKYLQLLHGSSAQGYIYPFLRGWNIHPVHILLWPHLASHLLP